MSNHIQAKQAHASALRAKEEGDFQRAVLEYKQTLQLDPEYAEAWRDLGWLLSGMFSKNEEGLDHLLRAKDLNDSLESVDLYLGIVLAQVDRHSEAEAAFLRAAAHPVERELAHAAFADYLACQGRTVEVEDHFKEALALAPDLTMAVRDYARFLASEGREELAQKMFQRAIDLDPSDAITQGYYADFQKRVERD